MDYKTQRIAILRSAIGHARCVLAESWQSVDSQRVARASLIKYRAELRELEAAR